MSEINNVFHVTVNIILCTVISGFGIIGNTLLLLSLCCKETFAKQLKPFLRSLAISDICMLTFGFACFTVTRMNLQNWLQLDIGYVYAEIPLYGLANMFYTVHIWTILLITLERYSGICHPMWSRAYRPRHVALVSLTVVYVAATGYNIPKFMEFTLENVTDAQGRSNIAPVSSNLANSLAFHIGFRLISNALLISIGPIIVIAILTGLMVRQIAKHVKFQTQMTHTLQGSHHNLTVTANGATTTTLHRAITENNTLIYHHSRALRLTQSAKDRLMPHSGQDTPLELLPLSRRGSNERCPTPILAPAPNSPRPQLKPSKATTFCSKINQSVIIIPITSIICYFLPVLRDLYFACVNPDNLTKPTDPVFNYIDAIVNLMVPLDGSLTFYVYFIFSARYRNQCLNALKSLCRHNKRTTTYIHQGIRNHYPLV